MLLEEGMYILNVFLDPHLRCLLLAYSVQFYRARLENAPVARKFRRAVMSLNVAATDAAASEHIVHQAIRCCRKKHEFPALIRLIAIVHLQIAEHIHYGDNLRHVELVKFVKQQVIEVRPYQRRKLFQEMPPPILM